MLNSEFIDKNSFFTTVVFQSTQPISQISKVVKISLPQGRLELTIAWKATI